MSRQALYRLYRPQTFADVAGQQQPVRILREAVRQNRLTHAYLFSGPRGTGKTSVARILAKAVNCDAPQNGEPCLACPSCRAFDSGRHLDIIEIDAASNRGIDEIRDIKERIAHLPVMSRMKVYIIDEVHMLTPEAFNALLKTLEEPPPHVMFILATTEPHKLPVTVLSRCQRYEFERLSVPEIVERLGVVVAAEGAACEPAALELVAEVSEGALRDALSLLDQVIAMDGEGGEVRRETVAEVVGALSPQTLKRLLEALANPDAGELIEAVRAAYQKGGDVRQMVRDIAHAVRDVMVFRQIGPQAFAGYQQEWLGQLDRQLPDNLVPDQWFGAVEALAEAEDRLRGGFPQQLILELALFKVQRQWLAGAAEPSAQSREPLNAVPLKPEPTPAKAVKAAPVPQARAVKAAAPNPPDPEPGLSDPPSDRVTELLERLRRERMSVYALVQSARIEEAGETLILRFAFAAHRDLLTKPENREVFDGVFHAVFGERATYRLQTEAASDGREMKPLKERVREVLGPEVKLSGFDEALPDAVKAEGEAEKEESR